MSKVFVQLVLSTVNVDGENQNIQTQLEVDPQKGQDPAAQVAAGINAVASDEKKMLSFPVVNGHVSIRGSAIEWFQVINVPEQEEISLEDIAKAAGSA